VVISVSGRYAEFQCGQSRKGVTCWQMPLDNRSNATFRQLVDDVVEHLLAILTRPEVAA